MVDRNLQVSYLVVDEMHNDHPELVRDQYWDAISPIKLPYRISNDPNYANVRQEEHPLYSTAKILPRDEVKINTQQSLCIYYVFNNFKLYSCSNRSIPSADRFLWFLIHVRMKYWYVVNWTCILDTVFSI